MTKETLTQRNRKDEATHRPPTVTQSPTLKTVPP